MGTRVANGGPSKVDGCMRIQQSAAFPDRLGDIVWMDRALAQGRTGPAGFTGAADNWGDVVASLVGFTKQATRRAWRMLAPDHSHWWLGWPARQSVGPALSPQSQSAFLHPRSRAQCVDTEGSPRVSSTRLAAAGRPGVCRAGFAHSATHAILSLYQGPRPPLGVPLTQGLHFIGTRSSSSVCVTTRFAPGQPVSQPQLLELQFQLPMSLRPMSLHLLPTPESHADVNPVSRCQLLPTPESLPMSLRQMSLHLLPTPEPHPDVNPAPDVIAPNVTSLRQMSLLPMSLRPMSLHLLPHVIVPDVIGYHSDVTPYVAPDVNVDMCSLGSRGN